jgi:hypothetical protein
MSSISGPSGYCFHNVEVPLFRLTVALLIPFFDSFFTGPRYTFFATSLHLSYLFVLATIALLAGRFSAQPRLHFSGFRDPQDA